MSFSKKLLIVFFLNCLALEIFTGFVTIKCLAMAVTIGSYPDFTPLITLITVIIGEAVAYAVYCAKSTKENTKGGIIYESALKENEDEGGPC